MAFYLFYSSLRQLAAMHCPTTAGESSPDAVVNYFISTFIKVTVLELDKIVSDAPGIPCMTVFVTAIKALGQRILEQGKYKH
jgi:hypothetical protein